MAQIKCIKWIKAPKAEVYSYLLDPQNLNYLLRKYIDVELVNAAPSLAMGSEYTFKMSRYHFVQKVKIKFTEVQPGYKVSYKQTFGLFKKWKHTQLFEEKEGGTLVTDFIELSMPFGFFGLLLDDLFIVKDMKRIIESRLEQAALHFSEKSEEES